MYLNDLPTTSVRPRARQNQYTYEWALNFQKNYINKYSVLFVEKEEWKSKAQRMEAIISEQKLTIEQLRSNCTVQKDATVQTGKSSISISCHSS